MPVQAINNPSFATGTTSAWITSDTINASTISPDLIIQPSPAPKPTHWYKTIVMSCVVCGNRSAKRKRQYSIPPEHDIRTEYIDDICEFHSFV